MKAGDENDRKSGEFHANSGEVITPTPLGAIALPKIGLGTDCGRCWHPYVYFQIVPDAWPSMPALTTSDCSNFTNVAAWRREACRR